MVVEAVGEVLDVDLVADVVLCGDSELCEVISDSTADVVLLVGALVVVLLLVVVVVLRLLVVVVLLVVVEVFLVVFLVAVVCSGSAVVD